MVVLVGMLLLVVAVLLAVLLAVVIELNVVLFKNRPYLFVYFAFYVYCFDIS